MDQQRIRKTARGLLLAGLALLLLWLALPRLLGKAAEHWLNIPGLDELQVDIATIGAQHARLSSVRATYRGTGEQRIRLTLREINVDYSLTNRQIERLHIGSGELEFFPGQTAAPAAWPRIAMPQLPLKEAHIDDLRTVIHRNEGSTLDVHGAFHLQQTEHRLQADFRPHEALLRITASLSQRPGYALDTHAEWIPGNGPMANARLQIPQHAQQQPALLVAHAPLPLLAELARALGVAVPLTATRGTLSIKANAVLGENTGNLSALDGEVQFDDAHAQAMPAQDNGAPLTLALSGKIRFAWQPLLAHLELQPGLNWRVAREDTPRLEASGRLEKAFAIHLNNRTAISAGEFPFALRSSQEGQWEGALRRLSLNADDTIESSKVPLYGWDAATMDLQIVGQLKQWQQSSLVVHDLQTSADMTLHWTRAAELHSTLSMRLRAGKLSLSGGLPLSASPSTWTLNAKGSAKTDSDFWKSLSLQGEMSSPQLNIKLNSGQTLLLGQSYLQVHQFHPGGPALAQNAQGELSIAVDAIRLGAGPATALRARMRLNGGAVHGDGQWLLKGAKLLDFSGSHTLVRDCGEAKISGRHALSNLDTLLQPRPPALLALGLQTGQANADFHLTWCTQPALRFNAKGAISVDNASLSWERARAEGVQTRLQLDGLQPLRGTLQGSARDGELATGTPFSDAQIDLALSAQSLRVKALSIKVFGGRIDSKPSTLPWPLTSAPLPLVIKGIDLGQLLALFAVDGLSGSGTLDGVLPVAYHEGGVDIIDGELHGLTPGTLNYVANVSLPDNPGLLALRNFHYRQLGVQVRYSAAGAYRVQGKLEGHNPDLYNGFPIRFGLNINGELPGLFRAALFSGNFNRHILEQLQSGKLE